MKNKETAKKEIWKVLSNLYDDNFDQSTIIDALADILREEVKDHRVAYNCRCSQYRVSKLSVPFGEEHII